MGAWGQFSLMAWGLSGWDSREREIGGPITTDMGFNLSPLSKFRCGSRGRI